MNRMDFKILTKNNISDISVLVQQLNSNLSLIEIEKYLNDMFDFDTYLCFGGFVGDKLVGVSSAWTTVRLYSGKQLEVDNVIVDNSIQSNGLGKQLFEFIEEWAKEIIKRLS